jgi:hypothetical protein
MHARARGNPDLVCWTTWEWDERRAVGSQTGKLERRAALTMASLEETFWYRKGTLLFQTHDGVLTLAVKSGVVASVAAPLSQTWPTRRCIAH